MNLRLVSPTSAGHASGVDPCGAWEPQVDSPWEAKPVRATFHSGHETDVTHKL